MKDENNTAYLEPDLKKSGAFLQQLRKEKKLTRDELAKIINISSDSVARYERGDRLPSAEILYLYTCYFNVSFEEIMRGDRFPSYVNESALDSLSEEDHSSKEATHNLSCISVTDCSKTDMPPANDCEPCYKSKKKDYAKIALIAFILTLFIALIGWFAILWSIKRTDAQYRNGSISTSIEEISMPEGVTIFDEAK